MRSLQNIERKIARKVIKQSTRAAGKIVHARVKADAPVRSGALRKSIKLRALRRSRSAQGVRIITGDRKTLGIAAGATGYYPAAIEYGTRRTPARPFIRPAFEITKGAASMTLRRELAEGIEREARSARVTT
jgi:HK97 gp10 family phage protein